MSLWLILNLFFLSINIAVQSLSTASQASPPPNKLSQLLKLSTYLPTAFHLTVSVLSSHLQNIPSSLSVQTLSLTRSSERQNATLSLPNQLFQSFLNSTPPLAKSPATLSPWQPLMTSQPSTTLLASPLQQISSVYPLGNSQSKGLLFFYLTDSSLPSPIYPSTYPPTHPFIHLSTHPSIDPSIYACMHACIHPFSHPSIYPCIHLPIHASMQKIHSCIHPSIHQPSHQSTHPHIHPSIYPCMYACILCIHPFIHPPVHPPLHASIHASMHPSTHTFIHAYINTYIHASIYTSIDAFRMHASIHRSVHSSPLLPPHPQQNSWVILFLKPNSHWSV